MANLVQGWNKYLRQKAKGDVGDDSKNPRAEASARPSAAEPPAEPPEPPSLPKDGVAPNDEARPSPPSEVLRSGEDLDRDQNYARKRIKSPANSIPVNSMVDDSTSEFAARRPKTKGRLWNDGDPPLTKPAASTQQQSERTPRRARASKSNIPVDDEEAAVTPLIKQPETRPISQEQLVAEVKGIYAGLVMVESKCIEVDNTQNSQNEDSPKLNNEQWQALIALHRTLLHEHHDFFLASQHPSASAALRRLASKYAMPARMWRHGIHSFLELLRHRLPASLEHMLTFIYLAYSMMALLYETVPAFEDTWIECLGDLGRYRMAIEDDDIRDREIWTGVSRHWYSKASDKAPTTGRLYHHLAILARPNAVQQLYYYTKSLCVAIPFKSARDSILTLFDPIMNGTQTRLGAIDLCYVKAHGILFIISNTDEKEKPFPKPIDELLPEFAKSRDECLTLLDNHIARTTRSWMEPGSFIAISNSNALLEYGKNQANDHGGPNVIMEIIAPDRDRDAQMSGSPEDKPVASNIFELVQDFATRCDEIVYLRFGDPNILPYLNVRLSFMHFMGDHDAAMSYLQDKFAWTLLAQMLTSLSLAFEHHDRIETTTFPRPPRGDSRPLPEDWSLRGLLWTEKLFPPDWFTNDKVDDDEKTFEIPSMTEDRRERVLWLGYRLASREKWILYDKDTKQFTATPEYHKEVVYPLSEKATVLEEKDDEKEGSLSRSSTFASATTIGDDSPRTWSEKEEFLPDAGADEDASTTVAKPNGSD